MPASGPRSDSRSLVPPVFGSGEVPAVWLDRLLGAMCALPIAQGPEPVAQALLDAVADILPTYAVGFCLAANPEDGGQLVIRRVPAGLQPDDARDPSRLFAGLAEERIFPVRVEPSGSTLHAASNEPGALAEGSPEYQLLERVAALTAGVVGVTRGLSRAKRTGAELQGLQAQVIQSEKLASLGQIAAGVVHELNNPLTSIVAYSDYLRRKAEREHGDPNDVERLRRIGEAADRILRFSRDLVAYARPSSEIPAPVVIHAVIDQALVFCEHVLSTSGVEVVRVFADPIFPVRGVPGQLTQVFVNLFTNACHAMDEGGGKLRIRTEMRTEDDLVRILVVDTGHGIDQEHVGRVFEPFFTTKTEGRGTGLGLSIVRNIIQSHGGSITVSSDAGHGTTFQLDLPCSARPPSDPPE